MMAYMFTSNISGNHPVVTFVLTYHNRRVCGCLSVPQSLNPAIVFYNSCVSKDQFFIVGSTFLSDSHRGKFDFSYNNRNSRLDMVRTFVALQFIYRATSYQLSPDAECPLVQMKCIISIILPNRAWYYQTSNKRDMKSSLEHSK